MHNQQLKHWPIVVRVGLTLTRMGFGDGPGSGRTGDPATLIERVQRAAYRKGVAAAEYAPDPRYNP
jgi:hypothetical protein